MSFSPRNNIGLGKTEDWIFIILICFYYLDFWYLYFILFILCLFVVVQKSFPCLLVSFKSKGPWWWGTEQALLSELKQFDDYIKENVSFDLFFLMLLLLKEECHAILIAYFVAFACLVCITDSARIICTYILWYIVWFLFCILHSNYSFLKYYMEIWWGYHSPLWLGFYCINAGFRWQTISYAYNI